MKQEEVMNQGTSFSPSSSEDLNPCPICLGPILHESYLNICFHKFCYNCILQWTKVVAGKNSHKIASIKCPFCKTENFSIIHGFDGSSFQQYYINQDFETGFALSKAHKYRLQCYYTESDCINDIFSVSRYWKSRKYLQPNRWLQSWLRREIQALIQEEDVDIITHHILGITNSFPASRSRQEAQRKTVEAMREEFQSLVSDAARPFLAARTDRFVNEVELFLASGLNVEAYDAVYKQRLGWSAPGIASEAEGEVSEHTPVIPYLYIFDEDYDEND